jgi:hypothetical protein
MSSIDSIASLSTALSQAQLQSAVSMKVLKMAQGTDQVAADMLADALDSVAQSMEALAAAAGTQIDTFA